MGRENYLDGELTDERKSWLSGILDSLKRKPSDSLSADENLTALLIGSVLSDTPSGIGSLVPLVASRGYRVEDDEAFCDVIVFSAAFGSKRGISDCSLFLGDCIAHDRFGLQEDAEKGSKYWDRAMKQGDPRGALRLADFFESLTAFKKEETVLRYIVRAALIGKNAEAFYRIGDFYFEGRVVGKDEKMAEALYRRSYDLAKEEGQDLIQACAALRLAEVKKDKYPYLRDVLPALDNSKKVLAYYTEAESIFRDRKADSDFRLKLDFERCLKGIETTKNKLIKLEEDKIEWERRQETRCEKKDSEQEDSDLADQLSAS